MGFYSKERSFLLTDRFEVSHRCCVRAEESPKTNKSSGSTHGHGAQAGGYAAGRTQGNGGYGNMLGAI